MLYLFKAATVRKGTPGKSPGRLEARNVGCHRKNLGWMEWPESRPAKKVRSLNQALTKKGQRKKLEKKPD
jgi:hypothetical protein